MEQVEVEIVFYDKLIDQIITMSSDIGTIAENVISIFENERLEYIGMVED